jgi:transcriptional regulator with XRE-family HTH domain
MKRHSPQEVAAKLAHAGELAKRGLSQAEICNTLGVSVMTLHRWRKMRPVIFTPSASETPQAPVTKWQDQNPEAALLLELQSENQELRKIITDLLLEKLRLEQSPVKLASKPNKTEQTNFNRQLPLGR